MRFFIDITSVLSRGNASFYCNVTYNQLKFVDYKQEVGITMTITSEDIRRVSKQISEDQIQPKGYIRFFGFKLSTRGIGSNKFKPAFVK